MGGWGGQNVSPAIPYADILLLTLNYTSPPSFIQTGPKLPKFLIWGGFGVGRVGGWDTFMQNFINIGHKM